MQHPYLTCVPQCNTFGTLFFVFYISVAFLHQFSAQLAHEVPVFLQQSLIFNYGFVTYTLWILCAAFIPLREFADPAVIKKYGVRPDKDTLDALTHAAKEKEVMHQSNWHLNPIMLKKHKRIMTSSDLHRQLQS